MLGKGLCMVNVQGREWNVNRLLFADDTALVTDSDNWQRKLEEYVNEGNRVNLSKSKVMKCSRLVDERRMNVALNGEMLEEVECFKYLGASEAILS